MRLKTVYVGVIFTLLLFLGIGSADALGIWITESSKVPIKIEEGEFAGSYDPGDIRGSYSFGDIEETFGVPVATLAKAFGITSQDPSSFLCKELETIYINTEMEIGTGSVRQFVAYYTGLPYESDDGFPSTAVETLKDEGLWTEAMAVQLEGKIISKASNNAPSEPVVTTSEEGPLKDETSANNTTEEHEGSTTVTGNTTVADAIDLGLTITMIEETLGVEVANDQITIRDLCNNNSLAFSEMKDKLNKLLP